MASGSLTAAALRHRPRQAVLLVILAGVVSASATLGPLYARATEQSVLRTVLSEASVAERGIIVTSTSDRPPSPQRLSRSVASLRARGYGAPIGGAETTVAVSGFTTPSDSAQAAAELTSRAGLCRHLLLVAGVCVASTPGKNVILVSQRNAENLDVGVGDQLRLTDSNNRRVALSATVVGVYRPFDAGGTYWFDRSANAAVPPPRPGEASPAVLDAIYTSWPTLSSKPFSQLRTHADVPLRVDQVDLRSLSSLRDDARAIDAQAGTLSASSATALPGLIAASDEQRSQARTVIPLLAIQLAVLGVVVLGFVCAAATEARRPEVALARLRGQGSAGAGALLLRELGLLVVVGTAVGAAAGWFAAGIATNRWLAPGVELELRWPVLAAMAAAAVAGILAVLFTAAPTLRQPLVSLLRRVPPRASALQVGLFEGALVAAAIAGEVTLFASSGSTGSAAGGADSPVALLAPGLLAVAGGLLLAHAVVPTCGPLARRALRKGNVVSALASTQVARRPALRRLISIITVACALLIFAVDTWEVADRNRSARASVENGAAVVLDVDAKDAGTLRSVVLGLDPGQRFATPVVTANSAATDGPRTTAVEPMAFARIARWGSADARPSRATLTKLETETAPPLTLTGDRLQMRVSATFRGVNVVEGARAPPPRPLSLVLRLVAVHDGRAFAVPLTSRLRQGKSVYNAVVPCADGCLLRRVEVDRDFGDFDNGVKLKFAVEEILCGRTGEVAQSVALGPATQAAWQSVTNDNLDDVTVDPTHPISFTADTFGSSMAVQRGDVPVISPALIAGDVLDREFGPTFPDPPALAPDLTGVEATYDVAGRLGQVPRTGAKGVLVNLDLLEKITTPTTQTSYAVWLASDDPPREHRLVNDLQRRGIVVTARDSIHDHEVALASEGPTLALRLALLAGVVSLALAAFVLVVGVATSSESRARDLAGLRVVGVPARVVRAAAIREHVTVAALGTLAGVSLGLAAAQAALPRLPLFAGPGPRLQVTHEPAWLAVGLAAVTCLVVLLLVSVFVGRSLAASATPDRLRGDR